MKFEPKDARYAGLLIRVMAIFDREKSKTVPIPDAIAAAEALGQTGDPRFETRERRKNWVKIDACEFRLEKTGTTFKLGPYSIGRYPVTVQEYAEFVEAGDYTNARWWEAGGHGKWREPENWEDQIAHPNRPVVGVNWFEATAFCRWLTQQLHPDAALIRLPREAEWERAAAGLEGREYPWGNATPDERLANFNMMVGAPTPVGVYPCGATPDGVADLAGNVWEWCENWLDEKKKQFRVLRGASWLNYDPDYMRCSRRTNDVPVNRRNLIGFRCVVVGESARLK
jgi:formylglycine-generating enzyme required for sulfatase activity